MFVRVPASSANLGPGFDTLGMALSLHADVGVGEAPEGAQQVDEHHPATVAFRMHGGEGPAWVRSPIPMGRGMGFSGAVRVGGLVAAHAQRHGADADALVAAMPALLALATELEHHADNVAASLYGGVVATAGGRAVRLPLSIDPVMVMWVPSFTTSTDQSRTALPSSVPLADVVFNLGRTALLVAALAAGDVDALREATRDRLHQDLRLAAAQPSRVALDTALEAGALAAWLSGSGPTVAAMCRVDDAERIAAALPADGHTKLLRIDHAGAVIEAS
ncbi:MAG TPA: homoserine kinase [Acidimicrobiaceae bacterium]|nr:homoserine kinase [Acidimicrobiaceae bacterium]